MKTTNLETHVETREREKRKTAVAAPRALPAPLPPARVSDFRSAVALANSADVEIVLDNAVALDDEGWGLIAPFGEWPKTRIYRDGGRVQEQKYLQVLDSASADAMVAQENSFFGSLKRALVGIPVFKGHGDLNEHDPGAVTTDPRKIKLGVVDRIRKTARGVEAHFALDHDGAAAVAAGWKFPSALWLVKPLGNPPGTGPQNGVIRVRPYKLLSVALTPFPNISGVESLANQRDAEPRSGARHAGEQTGRQAAGGQPNNNTNNNTLMKQLLIGWLAAHGIALANDATDQAVFDAFNQEMLTRSTSITALGNDKTTLNRTLTTLTADRDAQKQRADEAGAALAGEQSARSAERKGRAELAADLAIQRGRKTVADRDATITALQNSADFDAAVKALLQGKSVVKTAADAVSGKQQAALSNEAQQTHAEYQEAFRTELAAAGQDPVKAHNHIMRLPKYAGLAAKLTPQP